MVTVQYAHLQRFLDLCTINLITNRQRLTGLKPRKNAHFFSLFVVDLWVLRRVADSLKNGCFTRAGPADNENPEPWKFLSQVFVLHGVNESYE